MKSLTKCLSILAAVPLALALTTAVPAKAETYTLDNSHFLIGFTVDHAGFSDTVGRFNDAEVRLQLDTENPENSKVEAVIQAISVDTNHMGRDYHLRTDAFLDVRKYPTITFKSTKVEQVNDTAAKVTGDLTIKETTKSVVLDVRLNELGEHPITKKQAAGFSATTSINRSDYGVGAFVPVVGDELEISIEAELYAQ